MVQSLARIIQYGDEWPDLFLFTPFEEEEDWGDSVRLESIEVQQLDGAYLISDEVSKEPKVLTHRFTLRSSELFERYQTQKEKYGRECSSKQAYLTLLKDAYYRGIRGTSRGGKLKRLYVQMEDGSIRWTWAVPQEASYTRNAADQDSDGIGMTIDFFCPDPYFYEIDPGIIYYYSDFDMSRLVLVCNEFTATPDTLLTPDTKLCQESCEEHGLIVRRPDLLGYLGDEACDLPECSLDPCIAYLGEVFPLAEDGDVEICVEGSAGAVSPLISFRDAWDTPTLTNNENGHTLTYNGTIAVGEYLEINLGSSNTGDNEDLDIETNISGFDIDDLVIDNYGVFDLVIGPNSLTLTGTDGDAVFTINITNKYHN